MAYRHKGNLEALWANFNFLSFSPIHLFEFATLGENVFWAQTYKKSRMKQFLNII